MGLDIWQHRRCSFPFTQQVQEDTSDSLHYLLVSSTVKYLWTDSLMSLYCAHFRFLHEATTVRTNMILLLRADRDILDHQDRMLKHLPISASLLCLQALYFRQSWYRMVIYGILFWVTKSFWDDRAAVMKCVDKQSTGKFYQLQVF